MPRLLFVEDEPDVLRSLMTFFERQGFGVCGAQTHTEALQLAAERAPDLAIVDVMLGGAPSGLLLCRALRERGFDRPIIFLTGRATDQDKLRGFEEGADDYVTKPFSLLVLKARVERFLKIGAPGRVYRFPGVEIDLLHAVIRWPDRQVRLSSRERDLLGWHLEHRDRPLPAVVASQLTARERALLAWLRQLSEHGELARWLSPSEDA